LHHFVLKVFIVIVVGKGLLYIFLVKQTHVLLNKLAIMVFPLPICVVRIEVVSTRIDKEGRLEPLIEEIVPRKISQPGMVFHVFWAIKTQSV
jgi:hypothetical protein